MRTARAIHIADDTLMAVMHVVAWAELRVRLLNPKTQDITIVLIGDVCPLDLKKAWAVATHAWVDQTV